MGARAVSRCFPYQAAFYFPGWKAGIGATGIIHNFRYLPNQIATPAVSTTSMPASQSILRILKLSSVRG